MFKFRCNVLFAFLLTTGCAQMCDKSREEMSAEEVVEAYLDIALNMSSVNEKELLLEYTTGDLATVIASANDEAIRQAYIEKKYNLKKYVLMERRDRTPREVEIKYQLAYSEGSKDPSEKNEDAPIVTTENTVAVVKRKGIWYIHDVIGNKTSIEFPVTELNTIRAKP
ncbi:MAG: hypothetical protein R3B45_13655 [Bdellovibrionota bacterium]